MTDTNHDSRSDAFAKFQKETTTRIKNYHNMHDIRMAYPNAGVNSRDLDDMLSDMMHFHYTKLAEARAEAKPPFQQGDHVTIKGYPGVFRVGKCEWFDRTNPGIPHYWRCECTNIEKPVDWSKTPAGAIATCSSLNITEWEGMSEDLHLTEKPT